MERMRNNPDALTILNKSSEKATFSFIYKRLSWFDWTLHKKHKFLSTIELIITKVADFIMFHVFGINEKIDFSFCIYTIFLKVIRRIYVFKDNRLFWYQ